jgi:hypothetical protein
MGGGNSNVDGSVQLDEVRCWDEARTQAEIRENMYRPLRGDEANLRAYYRLDELTGTTAYDLTPNQAHGTLINKTFSSPLLFGTQGDR